MGSLGISAGREGNLLGKEHKSKGYGKILGEDPKLDW